MATEDKYLGTRKGAGTQTHDRVSRNVTLTYAAAGTVKDTIVLPAGSIFRGVQIETEASIAGSPTSLNVRVGTADAGQEVVADVDVKAQGHFAATIVTALAKKTGFASADTTLYIQGVLTGGTTGSTIVIVDFDAPRF